MRKSQTLSALTIVLYAASWTWADSLNKEPDHVYICTFNVYKLGAVASKYRSAEEEIEGEPAHIPERISNLAKVLAVGRFDLIVLQEVKAGEDGKLAVADLVTALSGEHNLSYKFFLSDVIGRGLVDEVIAFIYNESAIQPKVITGDTSLVRNIEIPGRDLVRTQWVAGDFDFTLIACHLAWGNEVDRDAGFEKVEQILTSAVPSEYSYDPDIIVLGDFNRFGKGYDSVKELDYDSTVFRAPNVVVFDPEFNEDREVNKLDIQAHLPDVNPQMFSTTVAKNTAVYDMILFTADAGEEFPQPVGQAVYEVDWGILHFDEPGGFGFQAGADLLSHDDLKNAYSDHRPLWMRFRTNTGEVDEVETGPGLLEYVGTPTGGAFHLETCHHVRDKPNLVRWKTRQDAINAGRQPCKNCKP